MILNLVASTGVCASLWCSAMAARVHEADAAFAAFLLALVIAGAAVALYALED